MSTQDRGEESKLGLIPETAPQTTATAPKYKKFCSCTRKTLILSLVVVVILTIIVVTPASIYASKQSSSSELSYTLETCIFHDTHMKNGDPLYDRCSPNSTFVKHHCNPDALHEKCSSCDNEILKPMLPDFCFCDQKLQCPNKRDRPEKINCLDCTKGSHCPCLEGTCKCSRYQEDLNLHSAKDHEDYVNLTNAKDHLFCQCYDGYAGQYCDFVPIRICNITQGMKNISNCAGNISSVCYMQESVQSYKCVIYKQEIIPEDYRNCTFN